MPLKSGKLWIVAVPIGNIDDLSPRARQALEEADLVLAEDTRRAKKLFADSHIHAKELTSFFEHNEQDRQPQIIEALKSGKVAALISDAGTPLMADPGYRLVKACRENGIEVSPVPGPCAAIAALSAAGLPPIPFVFLGFLPRSSSAVRENFLKLADFSGSMVFYERKNRIAESLRMAYEVLGERQLAICRELSKIHEEFILGELKDYASLCQSLLGELTIMIGPSCEQKKLPVSVVERLLENESKNDLKPKEIVKAVLSRCHGWTSSEIYSLLNK